MGVDARQRELNARDGGLGTAVEQDLPAIGRRLPGERGSEGGEVEARELHVELGKPSRVREAPGCNPRLHRLRHLQV